MAQQYATSLIAAILAMTMPSARSEHTCSHVEKYAKYSQAKGTVFLQVRGSAAHNEEGRRRRRTWENTSDDSTADCPEPNLQPVQPPSAAWMGGCNIECPFCHGWYKKDDGEFNVGAGVRRRRTTGDGCHRRRREPNWESMDNPCFHGPPPMPTVTDSLTADDQHWLDVHNSYRCVHGSPPLTWNHEIAASARKYAIQRIHECFEENHAPNHRCLLKHSDPSNRSHVAGYDVLGENIAALNGRDYHPGMGAQLWYWEILFTNGGRGTQPFFKPSIGHYSQVIWNSTREVGCSLFPDTSPEGKRHQIANTIFVCQYGPAQMKEDPFGNNLMDTNVLPRSVEPAKCKNPQQYAADLDCVPCGECNLSKPPQWMGGPAAISRRRCTRPTTTPPPSGSFYEVEMPNSGVLNTVIGANPTDPKADYELENCAMICGYKGSAYFIYGKSYRNKDCACITPGEELKAGDGNTNWDVYKISGDLPATTTTTTTTTTTEPERCRPNCPGFWLGDGMCDEECNGARCNYDGGDCDPAPSRGRKRGKGKARRQKKK